MADKCATLQRTTTSTHALRDAGSRAQSSNNSFIDHPTTELTARESDIATLSEGLPSTSTFLRGWEAVQNTAIALQGALVEQLDPIDQHTMAFEEILEITKELSGHISHSIEVFSPAMNKVQQNIVATNTGLLRPICRLPAEILQLIFEECVDAEAAEWFVDPSQTPMILQAATRIAGTCRSWRTIAHSTPRMWNRLRAPIQVGSVTGNNEMIYETVGRNVFCGSLRLCGSIPLEIATPANSIFKESDFKSLKIDRLNIYNTLHFDYDWSFYPWGHPPFPSPRHLWAVNAVWNHSYTLTLPSSLIIRTTIITVHNITVIIPKGSNHITQLVLCGVQDGLRLTSLLESLPYLTELDASRALMVGQYEQDRRALTHQKLKHLRIPISCMHALEGYLAAGLQLPSLSCFGLAHHLEWMQKRHDYTPSSFPSVSIQLPTTVTHLEVHGEHAVTTSSLSRLIETLYKIDTISTYGSIVGAVLRALCRTSDMPEDGKPSEKESLPSSIQSLHIHDYLGDGEDLYPALHQIYSDTEPIKIFFENCPNILPTTRRQFTQVGTTAARPSY
jgi:hypothetical protein